MRLSTRLGALRSRAIIGLGALLTAALVAGVAGAAPGDLDPSFGGDGTVTTEIGSYGRAGWAVEMQPDGKVVVGGQAEYRFALARYEKDGSLDTSFDGDGMVISRFDGAFDAVYALAIQQDGKIVAAGYATGAAGGFAVARYNPDGGLDSSFGGDGKVVTSFTGLTEAFAVAVQPDGKIVAAGHAYSPIGGGGFAVARYNPDGSLDATFDGDGKVVTPFAGSTSDDAISAIEIQSDGKLVVSGSGGPGHDFLVARYNTDGSLDTSFDGDGKVATDFGGYDRGEDLAIQPDGRIIVAGTGIERLALARFLSDGTLDTTFSEDGKLVTSFPGQGVYAMRGYGVALEPNGRIVAVGSAFPEYGESFGIVRYEPNGDVDTTFGNAGLVATEFGSSANYDSANDVALQSDGRMVVAGGRDAWLVARYLGDPVDTTPPEITAADITVKTGADGAVVEYTELYATDDTDPSPILICTPPSGSHFPVGDWTVTCVATDASGNTRTSSFYVFVLGPAEQLAELHFNVMWNVPAPGTSLIDKVEAAQTAYAAGDTRRTCEILAAFIYEVEAQAGKKRIEADVANVVIADAALIREVLGC